jgi:uncharacterized protein involved in exopolysaccharide biosynthesis/Mrp family chromosome partitioning ATPase
MNQGDQNDPRSNAALSSGLGLDDVYYTFFRHTKLILVCFALGLLAALVAKLMTPSIYSSKAKLRISYVMEEYPATGVATGDNIRIASPGNQDSILNSEVEILISRDVAQQAAEAVGPDRILKAYGGGTNLNAAAATIRFNLTALAPRRSDVVSVTYEHRDPEMVRPILAAVIRAYLDKHNKVHLGPDDSQEFVSQQLADLRAQLLEVEAELDTLLRSNKLVSPADTRRLYLAQIDRVTGELLTARTTLALRLGRNPSTALLTQTNDAVVSQPIPAEVLKEYSLLVGRLEALDNQEREYVLRGFRRSHPFIVGIREEIEENSAERAKLVAAYPDLNRVGVVNATNTSAAAVGASLAEVDQLQSAVSVYQSELERLQQELATLTRLEPRIQDLTRLHEEKEAEYKRLTQKVRGGDSRASNVPGVQTIEEPTPPARSDTRMLKLAGAGFGIFFFLGIILAVASDYVFDRTIKRSVDVERHLRRRVFYTIPHTFWTKRRGRSPKNQHRAVERKPPGTMTTNDIADTPGGLATWKAQDQLREHAEGLRERVVTYFEINELYHKPKLIALTSCHENCGVTSIANSLAVALSMTGEGNVMLVDLSTEGGAVTSFYRGKPGCGLNDALQTEDPQGAQTGDKLVVATASGSDSTYDNLARVLPTYFKESVPKLKTSGYDYILFDLPPVSQTSIAPRLSSQMDLVLMVLESEKTGQPMAKQATTLMREARANLFYVLNKCRRYVPEKLSLEL